MGDVMQKIVHLGAAVLVAGLGMLGARTAFAPLREPPERAAGTAVQSPDRDLLARYEACSRAAEIRVLSQAEVSDCSDTYLRLKLSFLSDVDLEVFRTLSTPERREAQQCGYRALRAWRDGSFGD